MPIEPEPDSHGGPTDTTGHRIDPPEGKKPRKQSTGKKRLHDLDREDAEKTVDRRIFQKNSD